MTELLLTLQNETVRKVNKSILAIQQYVYTCKYVLYMRSLTEFIYFNSGWAQLILKVNDPYFVYSSTNILVIDGWLDKGLQVY